MAVYMNSLKRAVRQLEQIQPTDCGTRSRSKMYPIEYRKVVLNIYNVLNSLRAVATLVRGPSIATISRWVKDINPKHGQRSNKLSTITNEMLEALRVCLARNPILRSHDLKIVLNEQFGINVSRQLVQLAVSKRLGHTFKRTKKRGPDRSDNTTFQARKREYVRELHNASVNGEVIISIDESGTDERATPNYGYAPRGSPAILYRPTVVVNQHHRTSFIMAIATNGVEHHEMSTIAVDGNTFADFIMSLPYPPGSVILLDNHTIHNTASVQVAIIVKGYRPLFTPPHSPEFNPIEMVFGTIKRDFALFRYNPTFTTVENALEMLIQKHCVPNKVQNYIRHVTDMANSLYMEAELTEGVIEAATPHPTHRVDQIWNWRA